jgi:hypothetical protein
MVVLLGCLAAVAGCGGPSHEAGPPAAQPPAAQPAPGGARTLPIPGGDAAQEGALPPGHPPIEPDPGTAGTIVPPPPGSGEGAQALLWEPPKSWISEPPASNLRKAQYRVPGPGGDGECVVFYFGPGQGGDPLSNAQRWASQFAPPDGVKPEDAVKTRTYAVGPVQVLEVETTGTYDGGQTMSAAPPKPQPGFMLLGAVAQGPDANWFFKFTGPEATVRSQRQAFEAMVRSLKTGA